MSVMRKCEWVSHGLHGWCATSITFVSEIPEWHARGAIQHGRGPVQRVGHQPSSGRGGMCPPPAPRSPACGSHTV
eukprot:159751-Chlamydomonas_euryale.AAC.4